MTIDMKDYKDDEVITLPLLALRGLVALPETHLHFDVGRKKSISAIDEAMKADQTIFLVTQRDLTVDEPEVNHLYKTGIIAKIKQVLRLPGDAKKVLIEGIARARLIGVVTSEPYILAQIKIMEQDKSAVNEIRAETLIRNTQDLFDEYASFMSKMPPEILMTVMASTDAGVLADYIASNTPLKFQDKQLILETVNPLVRLEKLLYILNREIEILSLDRKINEKVRDQLDKNQRDYYLREQLKVIQDELGDSENIHIETQDYRDKIYKLSLPGEAEEKLLTEADRLERMPYGSHEGTVVRTYLDTALELPWNKKTKDCLDIKYVEKILNKDHYGLKKVKERILEYLSVKVLSPNIKGQILCFSGPPGVGKTSVASSIARALKRKYVRVSLGGIRDEAEIRGHRKTYIGAMPGRIINAMKQAGTKNPLMLLDEVDKLGSDYKGDPASALLEVLDSEQNKAFRDHFIELPFDLSDVLFITTANTTDTVPRALLDRMEVIEISSYTQNEKIQIAKRHLIPKQLKRHGLNKSRLKIDDKAIDEIIACYTREAGVRNLEREIASICRKAAKAIVSQETKKVSINVKNIETFLGAKKFKREVLSHKAQTGIATGLAWTSAGGETLTIEVNAMEGTGKIELTGSLGDVMKESAKAAISYIRSRANFLGIDSDFYKNKDIHIHVPEGAVPKDGPSAGITIATAIVSELSNNPVRGDIAMTGEITLRGRVLPIGGLREKTMAAFKAGIKTVILPADNMTDLEEIENVVKENIRFIPVEDMDKVLDNAIIFIDKKDKNTAVNENNHVPMPEMAGAAQIPFIKQ